MQMLLKLVVGHLPPQEHRVSTALLQEYMLGIDTLWGLTFHTSIEETVLQIKVYSMGLCKEKAH